jgi:hypothetical protein
MFKNLFLIPNLTIFYVVFAQLIDRVNMRSPVNSVTLYFANV